MKTRPILFFLLSLAVLIASCSKDNKSDPNQVGTSGGAVTSSDNNATIVIPPSALTTNTTITIAATASHPSGSFGSAYDFGPSGTQFSSPVAITMSYKESEITGSEANLQMAYASNNAWISIPTTVDAANNKVTGTVNHFTTFGVVTNPLIGTWGQTSKATTNCGIDNSPAASCGTSCSTMVWTSSTLTVTTPGRATENYTYTVSGNAITLTPSPAGTVSITYSISGSTMTLTAVGSCTGITTWNKQ